MTVRPSIGDDAAGRLDDPAARLVFNRVSVHEAGHIVAARLLGHPLGGATVDPGDDYEGRVWASATSKRLRRVAAMPRMFAKFLAL